MASHDLKRQAIVEFLRRAPLNGAELFRGVVPWAEDVGGWRRASRETLAETAGRVVRRTIWDDPQASDQRLVVDVIECVSAREAVTALADRLEWNELAQLPPGPAGLGVASFVHPDGVPPAVFFARANLCVSVVSFGRRATPALPTAERIDRRLTAPPPSAVSSLRLESARTRAGEPVALSLGLPFTLADDGYLRYVAAGGALEIRDDDVVVIPSAPAETRVSVYAIEPGRSPAAGTVVVPFQ